VPSVSTQALPSTRLTDQHLISQQPHNDTARAFTTRCQVVLIWCYKALQRISNAASLALPGSHHTPAARWPLADCKYSEANPNSNKQTHHCQVRQRMSTTGSATVQYSSAHGTSTALSQHSTAKQYLQRRDPSSHVASLCMPAHRVATAAACRHTEWRKNPSCTPRQPNSASSAQAMCWSPA
jgi:hypothetical protein